MLDFAREGGGWVRRRGWCMQSGFARCNKRCGGTEAGTGTGRDTDTGIGTGSTFETG